MKLSKDPVKRAIRDEWYWPMMAEVFHRNYGFQAVMLPGSLEYDAVTAEKLLKIPREHMVCVDRKFGVRASFNRRFKGTVQKTGNIFKVIASMGVHTPEYVPIDTIGLLDLDLCECANPRVIEGLKEAFFENTAIAKGCAVGLTICRRWKTDKEQERLVRQALPAYAKQIDQMYYTNGLMGSHMATTIYEI